MRDDRNKWSPALGHDRVPLIGEGIEVNVNQLSRQTVVSGSITNCLSLFDSTIKIISGNDIASDKSYALRQRRDRLLVVNGPVLEDGWHSKSNVAVSDMSAAYSVISISGANVELLLSTGTEFDFATPSPSVSRLWHGFGILLYRHMSSNNYRMHIRTAHLESLWDMIERQIIVLSRV